MQILASCDHRKLIVGQNETYALVIVVFDERMSCALRSIDNLGTLADTLYINRSALHNASASKHFVTTYFLCNGVLHKSVYQRYITFPGATSKSNPPRLRNKEDQNGFSNISKVRVMQLTSELGETILCFGMGCDRCYAFERICVSAAINKLNYFRFESVCDCINNMSTWYSGSQIACLPY